MELDFYSWIKTMQIAQGEFSKPILTCLSCQQFYMKPNICREKFSDLATSLGLSVLVWRDPPRDNTCLGAVARGSEPVISQVFVGPQDDSMDQMEIEKKMFMLRKVKYEKEKDSYSSIHLS